jgi:imidazolonepropionase-like amidohydrolase
VLPDACADLVASCCDSEVGALDRVPELNGEALDAIITESLRRQLAAGVTTVRDLGDIRMRPLLVATATRRPRTAARADVVATGPPLTSVGGHCHFLGGEVASGAQISAAVRERVDRGVDVVKVMASGGMLTPGSDVMRTQFSSEDLCAIVEQAHDHGLPVTATRTDCLPSSSRSTRGWTAWNIAAA